MHTLTPTLRLLLAGRSISGGADEGGSEASDAGGGFTIPEKFKGKSLEDVARSYAELESLHGKLAKEAEGLKGIVGQWNNFGSAWKGRLERIGFDTDAFDELVSLAERAKAEGGGGGGRQPERPGRRWSEIADPREQEDYITHALSSIEERQTNAFNERLAKVVEELQGFVTKYGQYAIGALEGRMTNPGLRNAPTDKIIENALKFAKGEFDPMQMAMTMMAYPQNLKSFLDDHDTKREKEMRQKWEKEAEEKRKAAPAAASGGGSRSRFAPPGVERAEVNGRRVVRAPSVADVREAAADRIREILSS